MSLAVRWHDVECGAYHEDRELWRELARTADGPVLDVGAGTGRVALDLAAQGADVTALDVDAELLTALAQRSAAAGLTVDTVVGDARAFSLDRTFALIVVPMQTLQLLGGAEGRLAFLRCARAHLRPGGIVCAALADALESFDAEIDGMPAPDRVQEDGVVYLSQPLTIVDEGDQAAIHRLREIVGADGATAGALTSHDVIRLDRVTPAQVIGEAAALGFVAEPSRPVAATDDHVGSTVVVLRSLAQGARFVASVRLEAETRRSAGRDDGR